MEPRWVDYVGERVHHPLFLNNENDVIAFYNSIYDENQTGQFPPEITVPATMRYNVNVMNRINKAAEEASTRSKAEMLSRSGCSCIVQ